MLSLVNCDLSSAIAPSGSRRRRASAAPTPVFDFHVDDDCAGPEHDCPHELIAEKSPRLRREDNLTEVNETSQSSHDAKRDAQYFIHKEEIACWSCLPMAAI